MAMMTSEEAVKTGRIAGLLYLAIIVLGVSSEVFIRTDLIDFSDAVATARNVSSHTSLMKLSFAADAAMAVCDVALAVLTFQILRPAGHLLALLGMVFRLTQAAVLSMNLLNQHIGLMILTGGLPSSGTVANEDIALALFTAQSHGYDLGLVFFAMNCLFTGVLIWRAAWMPAWIGAAIVAAGAVYMAGSGLRFLAPEAYASFQPAYAIPLAAELSLALWLTIAGIRRNAWPQAEMGGK
ncbi:MAG: DUF4386 domain-containing protein [Nitratireductor sp.]|nr:DUF4386 domain-containing protein [Nitratireductor sp.]MCC0021382.1 DUF4386 domain-containing protein [Nitratireductor sp.]